VISFAIVTDGHSENQLNSTVRSIIDLELESFEIIIVGPSEFSEPFIKCVAFDDNARAGWITRKKNLAVSHSRGDIVVILHDYMKLNRDWTRSRVKSFSDLPWDVAMCRITNPDGTRFRDWTLWTSNSVGIRWWFNRTLAGLVPYSEKNLTRFMYVSGSVMIVRRAFMLENPLDENLAWGEGEDVEWSLRVRKFWNYKMFPEMSITSQKQKAVHFRHTGIFSRMLIKSYSILIESVLPKPVSSALEVGFIEFISGNPELKGLAERLTVLKNEEAKLPIEKRVRVKSKE
jgi:hypothetical protein